MEHLKDRHEKLLEDYQDQLKTQRHYAHQNNGIEPYKAIQQSFKTLKTEFSYTYNPVTQ